jgi:hypothetical protein
LTSQLPPGLDDELLPKEALPIAPPVFDAARYQEYVKDFDLSEEQQRELLQTLWWIMVAFVDLGFGVDSVQQCLPALKDFALSADANGLEQKMNTETFNGAAEEAEKDGR